MTARERRTGRPIDDHGDPLTFALAGLMAEAPGTIREYDVEDVAVAPPEGPVLSRPVAGRIRLQRTNRGLVLDAHLTATMAGECARCLRSVDTAADLHLVEEILPSIDLGSGLAVTPEEGEDPEIVRLTDHHELEVRPLVEEALAMAEPIAPLCEPDCPGLCIECGERLAPGHGHDTTPIDPRLAALRAFRVDDPAQNE